MTSACWWWAATWSRPRAAIRLQVTGDGRHTIRQLVEQVNADPLRGDGHATSLTKIRFDDIALATLKKQGYDADSVPPPGTLIFLRNNANLSTGGSATDVTDEVPRWRAPCRPPE